MTKVRNRRTGLLGAKKSLHPEHLNKKERRFRMHREVELLKMFDAQGFPKVLADNMTNWEASGTQLWAVVEWVEGPTLAEFSNGTPQDIDKALTTVRSLIKNVERCHSAGVLHRDIKPDNIILRDSSHSDPVLIDFGMGWAAPDVEKTEFATDKGQDLGNRFLRLPEYAPGRHSHEAGSDVTMLVAVLFYLLTGSAPRALLNERGQMPHEAMRDRFPRSTIADQRWPRLRKVFTIGFQHRLDMRYQNLETFVRDLDESPSLNYLEEKKALDDELESIHCLMQSSSAELLSKCQNAALAALQKFFDEFNTVLRSNGFEAVGQRPCVVCQGKHVSTTLTINKLQAGVPQVGFDHKIAFIEGIYKSSYLLHGTNEGWRYYYEGSLADGDSLKDAAVDVIPGLLTALLRKWRSEYEVHATSMRSIPAPEQV